MTQSTSYRNAWRQLRKAEQRALKTGDWGEWLTLPLKPRTDPTAPWSQRFEVGHKNAAFAVLVRSIGTPYGPARHAAIRNVSSTEITWQQKQRIKDELFGPESWAVEMFPPAADLVDAVNMYHLCVFGPEVAPPMDLNNELSGETYEFEKMESERETV